MIPAIDLFSGIGGWTTAARRTGMIDVRWSVDIDPVAARYHALSHRWMPRDRHLQEDCSALDLAAMRGEVGGGLLIASPPCQGFSEAGQPSRKQAATVAAAHDGKRAASSAVLTAAEALRPRVIVVENVERLLSWPRYAQWRANLEILGYVVEAHILDAAAYGAATSRKRAIITAGLGRRVALLPAWGEMSPTVGSCLDRDDSPGNRWCAVSSKPDGTRHRILRAQAKAGTRRGLLNNVTDVRLRPEWGLAPTLTTKSGSQLMLVDGDRVRLLNPAELARIQGWNDGEVVLPASRTAASILIGNAIPVPLAQGVLEQVIRAPGFFPQESLAPRR